MKYIKLFEQFINENLPDGVIRIFRTKDMKDWVKDVAEDDIETRSKDLKVRDYLVNRVVLKDGTKGWVWSKNETFEQFVTESKSDYKVYHNTYSSAVDTALDYAKSRGYEVVMDDVWDQISMGPKKPSDGKTNKAAVGLIKDGKLQRKALHIQIYGMGNRYELNTYIN